MTKKDLLRSQYYFLKGVSYSLLKAERAAEDRLKVFIKNYGALAINPDGCPHTITVFEDDEPFQVQIDELTFDYQKNGLRAHSVDGKYYYDFSFDDLTYLIEDLDESCLEYYEGAEE